MSAIPSTDTLPLFPPPVQVDPELDSLEDCQQKCQEQWNCDFFTYQWEMTGGEMVHKCYLKASYDNGNPDCNDDVWCDWSDDAAYAETGWHSGSGPKICTTSQTRPTKPGLRRSGSALRHWTRAVRQRYLPVRGGSFPPKP